MIINEDKVEVTGNIPFAKKVEMTLDPSAVAMHIRNMIRMYENPRLAALREYTSNARDAHQAAGYKGPVEVTLPTAMHPFLTVVDHGVGLDSEEIEGFGQFGRSTKAGSNDYIGGFGLGSKSGLAVAQQFTVIAVKDGRKNVVIVGRDEQNHPTLGFTAEQIVSEPNGVTIQIPSATHHQDWVNISEGKMFLGWEPGSIVINGKAPALSVHNKDQYKRLEGGWLTLKEREGRGYYYGGGAVDALVHGVYYSIPVERFSSRSAGLVLRDSVLEIENGAVDILPSRDNLEWTDRTIKAVNKAADTLIAQIVAEYQAQIVKVKTFREAKAIEQAMESIGLPITGLTWNGIDLSWSRVQRDLRLTVGGAKSSTTAKSGWQSDRSVSGLASLSDVWRNQSVLVTGASGTAVESYYKKNQRFHAESGESVPFIVAEAAKAGVQVRDVQIVFTEHDDPKTAIHEGFVSAFAKVITVADFLAAAKAQRAEWAKNRSASGGSRPVSTDRILRRLYNYDQYAGRTTTAEVKEVDVITEQSGGMPVVIVHAGDKMGERFLEAHTNPGNASAGMKSLMKWMVSRTQKQEVRFILLARNQKVDNLAVVGNMELSEWVKAEFAKIAVRTPMQVRAEAVHAKRDYWNAIPEISDKQIARIEDDKMREFYTAYMHPFKDGELGEAAKAFSEYAVTQPVASDFEPTKAYPLLTMLSASRATDGDSLIVDYFNLVHSQP